MRWLSLLLISPNNNSELPNALFKTALARARMAELLAENRLNESEKDQVFMAGMFSLLDAAFSMPLDQLLNSMNLPDAVSRALLTRSGPIAPFLMLSEAAEKTDIDQITVLASKLDLSIEQISHAHMEALTWAEGLV